MISFSSPDGPSVHGRKKLAGTVPRWLALGLTLLSLLYAGRPSVNADTPLGKVAAVFPYTPSKLVTDPVRARVYVADVPSQSIVVINTTSLQVIATVPLGATPVDIAVSPDGALLYAADSSNSQNSVHVIDLSALTVTASFVLPGLPLAIAASLNGLIYVSCDATFQQRAIYQIDATTGSTQYTFNATVYDNDFLQITPNGQNLFVANRGGYINSDDIYAGTLKYFSVSPYAAPSLVETNGEASNSAVQLVVSPKGNYLCLPSGGGNSQSTPSETYLFPTTEVSVPDGSLVSAGDPGPLAFSPDESVIYQTVNNFSTDGQPNTLQVFSTQRFGEIRETTFPAVGPAGYVNTITSIVTDLDGKYLFIGESATATSGNSSPSLGQLVVIETGSPGLGFFTGETVLNGGYYYLQFSNGNYFGYYAYLTAPYIFHSDLGYEYIFDAADGSDGIYLYDFASDTFFYTSPNFPFPYLYDFTLNTVLYYFPSPTELGHYNTGGQRFFYRFDTGQIFVK